MHIIENYNTKAKKVYCYAGECLWDKQLKKYVNLRTLIGYLKGEPSVFVPNKKFASLLLSDIKNQFITGKRDREIIDTVNAKYGNSTDIIAVKPDRVHAQTARAIFLGPVIVFGGITSRYQIDIMLRKAFGEEDSQEILSLAWFLASEGDALINSDVWLSQYENPAGGVISSQDITRLLDRMGIDGIMTFYKEWLGNFKKKNNNKVLYDLTSISWYGQGINMAGWGHNRDNESLPQVKFALLCARDTAMPLFAWPLDGSISDVRTLQNTLQLLDKLNYKPDCLMMDRGFSSMENISYMLGRGYVFLQALRVNADWIYSIIDAGRIDRLRPNSMVKAGDKTYYVSTIKCRWVTLRRLNKKKDVVEETLVYQCKEPKGEKYTAKENEDILSQYPCMVHVLFCQDLIGCHWDKFMENLNREHERLVSDEKSAPVSELKRYFIIKKEKWARKRTVEFNMENIAKHRDNYAGHICFITNPSFELNQS
jgi:hypothetical protein